MVYYECCKGSITQFQFHTGSIKRALQDSISAKNTLDMFSGTTEALDAAEVELQGDIDHFLHS